VSGYGLGVSNPVPGIKKKMKKKNAKEIKHMYGLLLCTTYIIIYIYLKPSSH